jgi:outer membrane protein assembly factor BamB
MASPVDLDHRLRAAAGPEPDTERALADVMQRIRCRTRRTVVAAVTVVAVVGVLVAVWVVDRQGLDRSPVFVGEPTTTSPFESGDTTPGLRRLWTAQGMGMGGGVASNGQLVVSVGDVVFAANGFGSGQAQPVGRVTALDRATGEVRWAAELGDFAFLQGAAGGIVIVNTSGERVVGLDGADGTVRWEISLSALGLDGYDAVRSAVATPRSAIGLSADSEGDVRPPVILGLDTNTGEVAWTTALAEGTDLNWGTPPVSDGATVFLSTPSHQGSAVENVAHLIELADGSVRWSAGLGGGQGFSEASAVSNGPYLHLPAFPDVVTVDQSDGRRLWDQSGRVFVTTDEGVWTVAADGALALLEATTGDVVREVYSPVQLPVQLLDLGDGLVGVVSYTQFAAIDSGGEVQVLDRWPLPPVELARSDRGVVIVATEDQAVTAYEVEPSDAGESGALDANDAAVPRVWAQEPAPMDEGGLAAIVSGSLTYDATQDCFLLELEGIQYPVVWPAGAVGTSDGPGVVLRDGSTLRVGDEVSGGGGYLQVSREYEIPIGCLPSTGEVAVFNANDSP